MTTIKIHKFIEGPFEEEDGMCYNICLGLFPDNSWAEVDVYYSSFSDAYKDTHTINRSPEPVEIEYKCLTSNLN